MLRVSQGIILGVLSWEKQWWRCKEVGDERVMGYGRKDGGGGGWKEELVVVKQKSRDVWRTVKGQGSLNREIPTTYCWSLRSYFN